MPDNKNQHYVPRCYLRAFAPDAKAASLNLLNVQSEQLVPQVSMKGQCAKPYFYGKDGKIEKLLQGPEGEYSSTVRAVAPNPHHVSDEQLEHFLDFATLQTFRSRGYVEKLLAQAQDLDSSFAKSISGRFRPPPPTISTARDAVLMALGHYAKIGEVVADLDRCLIVNESRLDFVTSDDPSIHINRFYTQRGYGTAFGYGSSGIMLFLPLTPRLAFMAFDPHVYWVPSRRKNVVVVERDDEALGINELQFLHARNSVYFRNWSDAERIRAAFNSVKERRPKIWHKFAYFQKVGEGRGMEKFERVERLELRPGMQGLTAISSTHIVPARWPKVLAYRQRPKFIDTGTGGGVIRPDHPLLGRRPTGGRA